MLSLSIKQQNDLTESFKAIDKFEKNNKVYASVKKSASIRGGIKSMDLDTVFR